MKVGIAVAVAAADVVAAWEVLHTVLHSKH